MLTLNQFFLILILLIIAIGFIIYLRYLPQQRGGFCNNTNNCGSNLICSDNVCIYNPNTNITVFPADICYANSECPQGYYCSNVGTCLINPASNEGDFCIVDQECTIGNYCTFEQICLQGQSYYYLGNVDGNLIEFEDGGNLGDIVDDGVGNLGDIVEDGVGNLGDIVDDEGDIISDGGVGKSGLLFVSKT